MGEFFDSLVEEPGTRMKRLVAVPSVRPNWDLPVLCLSGVRAGPRLVLIAGLHAAEYAGSAAVCRLVARLEPYELSGSIVAVPIVNTPGLYERTMFVNPRDGRNLNRVFPGHVGGCTSERVAAFLFREFISAADAFIDLHGGDLVEALTPYALWIAGPNEGVATKSHDLARAYDLDYSFSVEPDQVAGRSHWAAVSAGVPALLAECGGRGVCDEEAVERHVRGLVRVLRHLGMLSRTEEGTRLCREMRRLVWVRSEITGMCRWRVALGERVEAGSTLGDLVDVWGDPVGRVEAPIAGVVVIQVTAPPVSRGGKVAAIGVEEET